MPFGEVFDAAVYEVALDVEFNKKNRVTVAQFASDEAIANTPRSPRFDNIIPQTAEFVNTSEEKSKKYSDRSRNNYRDILANVPADSKTQSCINCKVSS